MFRVAVFRNNDDWKLCPAWKFADGSYKCETRHFRQLATDEHRAKWTLVLGGRHEKPECRNTVAGLFDEIDA